jgi:hypothetical protein
MARDPAYQPQPKPENNHRRTDAEKGLASWGAPDEAREVEPGEGKTEDRPDNQPDKD